MALLLRSRWLYLNILALIVLGTAVWQWQTTTTAVAEAEASWIPDYYLTNATIDQYDDQGQLSSSIYAQRFSHISEFDTTDMTEPRFNIYLNATDSWFGRAQEGLILDSGAQINLTGDVVITNGPDLNRPLSLSSNSIRLFPNSNYAESDLQVKIQAKHSHLTGTGMRLTLSDQRLQLLSQVTGTHTITR